MNIRNIDLSLIETDNKWIERIFANIKGVVVDSTIYIEYTGASDKKEAFTDAYKKYLPDIKKTLYKYGITSIKSNSDLNDVKLSWLKDLINVFEPKKIEFSIKNWEFSYIVEVTNDQQRNYNQ